MKDMSSPAIRFAGFTDSWEQQKLGKITKSYSGGTPLVGKSAYYSGPIPFIRSAEINSEITELSLTENGFINSSAKMVYSGDILYALYGATSGEVGIAQIQGAINQAILAISPNEGYDSFFIMQWLRGQKQKIINKYLQGGQGNLSGALVKDFLIQLPGNREQNQIGTFLSDFDRLVTLHQREYDKTVNIKKSLLEKMFPKDGENKPEIRFAGFTDAWEQRKVGDFYFFKNGLNKSKKFFGIGTPIVNFTDVFHNRGLEAKQLQGKVLLDDSEIKNFEVRQGDIFFTRTSETINEIGYPSVMLDAPKSTVFSGFVLRGRAIEDDPMADIFKRYVFFTETFRSEMIKKSSMTTRALTSGTAIKEMYFNYPASKKEQKQIGSFFSSLDSLITLHKHELTKLQNIKKALLEKMFV